MEALKRKLADLGITHQDLARRAGRRTPNVQAYFSDRDLGPGPAWVEETIRAALLEAGVGAVEVSELVGGWKRARLCLNSNRGDEMTDKALSIEQRIGNLVKGAWTLSIDARADIIALKATIQNGMGIDETTRARGAQKRFDDELAGETAEELRVELWQQREQALRGKMAAADQQRQDLEARVTALSAAIAGVGDDNLLRECKELGVDPQDRLDNLRKHGIPDAVKMRDETRRELTEFPASPLHPSSRAAFAFGANNLDEAARILSQPWTVAEASPELALAIFGMRRQIAPVADMGEHLRLHLRAELWQAETTYTFFAGLRVKAAGQPPVPSIWCRVKDPASAQNSQVPSREAVLFSEDESLITSWLSGRQLARERASA